ncbi:hypothetical protein KY290_013576 [Solanum tuberosum]|uniref:DUF4283 domain-containing protein n=1 Tax=Solanum tuberosum TaxID=4113 RepID=A0ABQ7VMS6_SOLTU|nr:hypothetical protein KY289_013700 [Solanum tuberosum]KAH0717016.1 hypothetical protein KY285_013047 [Solanum tuberosum]KAH0769595.1 hypothetical protein KY290_013576 [Solanum tuberosum]
MEKIVGNNSDLGKASAEKSVKLIQGKRQNVNVIDKGQSKVAQEQWNEMLKSPSTSGTKSWADVVEEEVKSIPVRKVSIWDDFDISKVSNTGFKLEYVEPTSYDSSAIVDIDLEDISSEIAYWKNYVVCYVLGAHPPFTVMQGFIQRLWVKNGINKFSMLRNGIVLVRFDSAMGKDTVIEGGIYHFDNKPFIVKEWSPDMEYTRAELLTVPIWVKFPGLDFKYWSPRGLSKIGSLVGKPLMVDHPTQKKVGLNFAR